MHRILPAYLIVLAVMSVVTFAAFAWDKRCARRGAWRMPEKTLLTLCALCGAPGGMAAMRLCRHKTKKPPFPLVVPLLCIAQGALLLVLTAF